MIRLYSSNSADNVWQKIRKDIISDKRILIQSSRAGMTKELLHVGISIDDPRQRWILSRTPPINPTFAISEIVWIINGRNDSEFLNRWNSRLPKYSGNKPTYHGAYGYRLRNHFNLDQIRRAYNILLNNPNSRQVVLQYWDPSVDMPKEDGSPQNMDIPCNVLSIVKVREHKLEWLQIMRSNDIFLGFPYNVVQFTSLQEILAGWLDIEMGSYNHISDSMHLYLDKEKLLRNSIPIKINKNSESIMMPRQKSEAIFRGLADSIEALGDRRISDKEITRIIMSFRSPDPFKNMLRVVGAEAARQKKYLKLVQSIMSECTNPVYRQIWKRWVKSDNREIVCQELKAVPELM